MLTRVCHDGLREITLPFGRKRGMVPAILKWGLRYRRASPRAATDRVPLRLSLAHAMHPRHRNLMLNIEHLTARVGQLRDGGAARATHSVSRWRWRSVRRAGDAIGCCAGPAARRSPNRCVGSRTDKATDRSLVEVVGICARRGSWLVRSQAASSARPPCSAPAKSNRIARSSTALSAAPSSRAISYTLRSLLTSFRRNCPLPVTPLVDRR